MVVLRLIAVLNTITFFSFGKLTITAKIDGENTAGGVLAYRCTENRHIFFVRVADAETIAGRPLNL
jgi:hypothetical protein